MSSVDAAVLTFIVLLSAMVLATGYRLRGITRRQDLGRLSMHLIFDSEQFDPREARPSPFLMGHWRGGSATALELHLRSATYGHGLFQMAPELQPLQSMHRYAGADATCVTDLTPAAAALGDALGLCNIFHPKLLDQASSGAGAGGERRGVRRRPAGGAAREAAARPRRGRSPADAGGPVRRASAVLPEGVQNPFQHLPGVSMWGQRVPVWICQVSEAEAEGPQQRVLLCPTLPEEFRDGGDEGVGHDRERQQLERSLAKAGLRLSGGRGSLCRVPLVWNNITRSIAGAGRGDLIGSGRHPHCRIGVCVLVEHPTRGVLLTRRARHMRTFPGAWVIPGGGVEAGESLEEAGLREILEETGLSVPLKALRPLGLWESCFPSTGEDLSEAKALRGHHLVVIYHARLGALSDLADNELRIQHTEADLALWLSREQVADILTEDAAGAPKEVDLAAASVSALDDARRINLDSLRGIYPYAQHTAVGMEPAGRSLLPGGIGEAHLFALREWYAKGI